MAWFTASIVVAIKLKENAQEKYPVFEDFYLIEGDSPNQAYEKAVSIGRELEALEDNLTLRGQAARRLFVGIRKLRSIFNPAPYEKDTDSPVHGTELSHSYMIVNSEEDLNKLGRGEAVEVLYVDDATDV